MHGPVESLTAAGRFAFAAVMSLAFATSSSGQVTATGSARTSLYAWQSCLGVAPGDSCDENRLDFYQGLRLRLGPRSGVGPTFRTYLRVANRGQSSEWDGRLFNANLRWQMAGGRIGARVGRQFLYNGVINGTADAVNVRFGISEKVDLRVVGGVSAPENRELEVLSLEEGAVLGAYGTARFSPSAKLDVSYFQRTRSDALAWQVAGAALTGSLTSYLAYFVQFDYNLQTSDYQGMRYRLAYLGNRWQLSGEYQSQRPRIFEDSFFNRFHLVGFDQVRGAVTYRLGRYAVTLQDLYTLYQEGEKGNQIMASIDAFWGSIGFVFQSGFGGDRVGVFGTARYEFVSGWTAKIHSSYYNFQRFTADFDEDATAFSAGLDYRPVRSIVLEVEAQQSLNSLYNDRVRGLFRFTYLFSSR